MVKRSGFILGFLMLVCTSVAAWATPIFEGQSLTTRVERQRGTTRFTQDTHRIIVFGDSLSDSEGRLARYTGGLVPPPLLYWAGRASNGPLWSEYLAASTNVTLLSYAYGGARLTKFNNYNVLPSATRHLWSPPIHHALLDAERDGLYFDVTDLVVLWIGNNDFLFEPISSTGEDYVQETLRVIEILQARGAQRLMVVGIPDVSKSPYMRSGGSPISLDDLSHRVADHNMRLRDAVISLQRANPNHAIDFVTVSGMLDTVLSRPHDFGLDDTQKPCLTGSTWPVVTLPFPPIPPLILRHFLGSCPEQNKHLFWDSWHPNTVVHCLAHMDVLSQLAKLGRVTDFDNDYKRRSCLGW